MKKKYLFDNGLSLILDKNSNVSTVTYSIYFSVGSLYENEKNQGISHLVEHMFFRRLNKICQKDLYFKMESLAGSINGTTSKQYVCFDFTIISEYAVEAFGMIKELLSDFSWSQEELEAEKRVVCREIEFRGNDYNYFDLHQMNSESFSRPIKGSLKSIENLTLNQVNKWKEKYFSCNNACFVAVGNYDENLKSSILNDLAEIKPIYQNIIPKKFVSPQKAFNRCPDRDLLLPNIDGDIADVSLVFDIDLVEINYITSRIIFDAFCCGNGSKLSFMLKDTYGFIDDMYSDFDVFNGYGRILINWSVSANHLFESLNIFFEQLKTFKSGITEKEYISSIGFSTVNAVKFRDNTYALANQYGYFDFVCNIPFSIENSVAFKNTITVTKLNEAINSIFVPQNLFVYVASNRKHIKKKDLISYFKDRLMLI